MSNKGLNSNEALEESTATNSSVTLSGIRREKDTPGGLNIEDYTTDAGKGQKTEDPNSKHSRCGLYGGEKRYLDGS